MTAGVRKSAITGLLIVLGSVAQAADRAWFHEGAPATSGGATDSCWPDRPVNASVYCATGRPEHVGDFAWPVDLTFSTESETTDDIDVAFRSRDLTAMAGTNYASVDRTLQAMSLVDNPTRHVTITSTVLRADLPDSGQRTRP